MHRSIVAVEATEDDLKKLNVTHTVYFADDALLLRHENRWIGLIRLADPHADYKVWEPGGAHPLFDFVRAVEKDKEEMKGMGILTEEAFELFKEYRKSATIGYKRKDSLPI